MVSRVIFSTMCLSRVFNYKNFPSDVSVNEKILVNDGKLILKILETNKNIPLRILGGGSNILFTEDFDGLTLLIANKGKVVLEETSKTVIVEVQAGENWHEFVMWCLNNNYGGIENLALIPGRVGATPIQNIGAYGVELNSVFKWCKAINIATTLYTATPFFLLSPFS